MTEADDQTRDADLVAYYDNGVDARGEREPPVERQRRRAAFVELLRSEGRQSILEVGAGPGRDGVALAAALEYTGLDLSPRSVARCRALGRDVRVASVLQLPFDDGSFDAGWTMSTLLHVSNRDLTKALTELVRVLLPGAPLAVGLWGGTDDHEMLWDDRMGYGPPRFFSMRSDDTLRAVLSEVGLVEEWAVWPGEPHHYQWAVLRTPARPHGRNGSLA